MCQRVNDYRSETLNTSRRKGKTKPFCVWTLPSPPYLTPFYFISSLISILYVYSTSAFSSPLLSSTSSTSTFISTSNFISTSITSPLLSTHPCYGRSIVCIPCWTHWIRSIGVYTAPSCMQRGVRYIEINIKPMQRCP